MIAQARGIQSRMRALIHNRNFHLHVTHRLKFPGPPAPLFCTTGWAALFLSSPIAKTFPFSSNGRIAGQSKNIKPGIESREDLSDGKFGMPLRQRRNLSCEWRLVAHARRWKMDGLKKTASPDRSKINMHEPYEVKYWTKKLGVTKERLQKVVDKVGNAAAAVRKELAT
jgi:hypothetical protein